MTNERRYSFIVSLSTWTISPSLATSRKLSDSGSTAPATNHTHTRDERRWGSRFSRGNRGYSAVMGTEFTATPRGWDQLHGSTAGTGTKLVHGNTVGAGRFLVPVQLSSAVHRRIRRIAFRFPVLGSQPAGDVSHIPGGRLPSLSARPAVIPATLKRAATNFVAW